MKKKLAFVDLTDYLKWPMGGMLEYELAILPYLAKHYDMDLWGVSVDGAIPPDIKINNKLYPVHVFCNCHTHNRFVPNYLKGLKVWCFRKKLAKYDIIYAHTGTCIVALAGLKHVKKVYHHHGLSYLKDYRPIILMQRPFYHMAQAISDVCFIVSDVDSVKRFSSNFHFKLRGNFVQIGSPIRLDKFDGLEIVKKNVQNRIDMHFIYVGRIDAWKNLKLLIEAFYINCQKHPNDKFTIVGDGPELESVKHLSESYGLYDKICFTGRLKHDDVYKMLLAADVYIIASHGEGWSVAVLEANATGLPVICGDVPGLRGEVINGRTGVVVRDYSANGFASSMSDIRYNLKQLSDNALIEARNYDAEKIAAKVISEIDKLLSKGL